MTQRAAIYARVSTDEQRGNYSVPTQVREAQAYAEKRGYTVVGDLFVDPETGLDTVGGNGAVPAFVDDYTSLELSRPGIDAAFSFLEAFGFDVLVVHSLDRLARDPYSRQTLEIEFDLRGARVEYVLGGYEDSPDGQVRKDIESAFARWENLKRAERSKRGKREKARQGKFVAGQPPFGYRLDDQARSGIAIVESDADVVRRIFSLYGREGLSIRGIAELLSEEGVPSPTGRPTWGKSTISKILRNESYAGVNHYNKHRRVSRTNLKLRSRESWIPIEAPEIVEGSLFQLVQQKLERNAARRRREPQRFYLLAGMIECDECGRPYSCQTQKAGKHRRKHDAPQYRHRAKAGHCHNRMISARKVDRAVWEDAVEKLLRPEELRQMYLENFEHHNARFERQRRRLEVLEKGKHKHQERQSRLLQTYLDPETGLTRPEFIEQRTRITQELENVDQQIEQLTGELAAVDVPPDLETIEAFADVVRPQLEGDDLTPQEKRRILETLQVRVRIPLKGRLEVKFGFELNGQSTTTYSWRVPQPFTIPLELAVG